jgi:hypothetical protein
MSDVVIRVEGVSKLYRLGEVGTGSLAHDVNRWWHRVRGKENPYLKIGEVNDRTKPAKQASSEKNLTTEDTIEHQGRCEKEQPWLGPKGEGVGTTESKSTEVGAGMRLAGQAGAAFPNPSTSELASDSENTSLVRSANSPHSSEEQSDSKALATSYSPLVTPKASPSDWVYALKDVSFEVKRGEVLGIIGHNGAGKTTHLKMINGLIKPDRGTITMWGRVGVLITPGTGFHPELTGREPEGWEARRTSNRRLVQRMQRRREGANQNIFLNGAILGMRKAEIARKFDEIVEFSGCASYIDTPVTQAAWQLLGRLSQAA